MRKFLKTTLAAVTVFGAVAAHAYSDTANLGVSLTITPACDVTTTAPSAVSFASHAQSATGAFDSTGAVTVTCFNSSTAYTVKLGNGGNYSSSRRMVSGANFVPYELYSDNLRTQVWGETIGTDTQAGSGTQTFTVYGRVPSVNFAAGNYTDTVQVTVDY